MPENLRDGGAVPAPGLPSSEGPTLAPEAEIMEGLDRVVRARVTEYIERIESFSGPLPPPAALREYNDVLPGAAERILAMAERQAEHRQDLEGTVVRGGARRSALGLWLGFVVSLIMIAAGTAMVLSDHDWAGASIIGANLVSLVGVFIYGRSEQRREREVKAAASTQSG